MRVLPLLPLPIPSPCSLQCVCAEHVIKKKFVCALRCIFFSSFFFWYFSAVACQIKCQVYVTVKRLKNVDKEAAKKRFENCVLMSTRALFSFFFQSRLEKLAHCSIDTQWKWKLLYIVNNLFKCKSSKRNY